MRVERVVAEYKNTSKNRQMDEVYKDILNRYSDTSVTASEIEFLLKNKKGTSFVPEKTGLTTLEKKEANSKRMREKMAQTAAAIICTDKYELENYKTLFFIMDYHRTQEAEETNKKIAEVLLQGTREEKLEMFWGRLKPLTQANESELEWKSDDDLVNRWEHLEALLYQFAHLDQIVKEAMEAGVEFPPELVHKIQAAHKKGELPARMILHRAGVIANSYYSMINDMDLRKIDSDVLEELKEESPLVFRDYLEEVTALKDGYEQNVTEQLDGKLRKLGYKDPKDAVLADVRGTVYEVEKAIEMLKAGRMIYVLDENGKKSQSLELVGQDGFLKPVVHKKKDIDMKEYLRTAKRLVDKIVEEGKPLSAEGIKVARRYMATMVCFEKIMNERNLGNIRLWHAIGTDEKRFSKAVRSIYEDQRFQALTKEITIESLRDFVHNQGEKKLAEAYTSAVVADKKEIEGMCRQ